MKMITYLGVAALALGGLQSANAATVIFTGQDDGVGPGGPFPNSAAAEAAYLAAASAHGSVATETFESATVGDFSPVVLDDFTITTGAANLGAPYSGINNTTLGVLYGFNTTVGGEKWYGFPDFDATSAEFTFNNPTKSMGAWITGIQALFTAQLTLELVDGSQEIFFLPLNADGGAQFYGVVSTIAFTKVLVRQIADPGYADAFGIDDISYNDRLNAVPEPAAWAMLIAGFGMIGSTMRRRRMQQIAA